MAPNVQFCLLKLSVKSAAIALREVLSNLEITKAYYVLHALVIFSASFIISTVEDCIFEDKSYKSEKISILQRLLMQLLFNISHTK